MEIKIILSLALIIMASASIIPPTISKCPPMFKPPVVQYSQTYISLVKTGPSDYASCVGRYMLVPKIKVNGKPIWISTTNNGDRFIFQNPSGAYAITATQYLQFFITQNKKQPVKAFGAFHFSQKNTPSIFSAKFKGYQIVKVKLSLKK